MVKKIKFLFINPPIEDFQLLGGWIYPYGFLQLASFLQSAGAEIRYIDALYRWDDDLLKFQKQKRPITQEYGYGRLYREVIQTPDILSYIPMHWKVYGIPYRLLEKKMKKEKNIDAIFITTCITYHYVGAFKVIELCRKLFPGVPILFGGIFATLCYDYAVKHSGADYVFRGEGENNIIRFLKDKLNIDLQQRPNLTLDDYPFADWSLYLQNGRRLDSLILMTSRGCPFRCPYCASSLLQTYRRRSVASVISELKNFSRWQVKNVVLYDDALLLGAENYFDVLMKDIIKNNLRFYFHTPNSLHASQITLERAKLMRQAGFRYVRVSLETLSKSRQAESGKVQTNNIITAVNNFLSAGFHKKDIGVYYMIGQPGQDYKDMIDSMSLIASLGVTAIPLQYSLIPSTTNWKKYHSAFTTSSEFDPLLSNKECFLFRPENFERSDLKKILRIARIIRSFVRYNINLWSQDLIISRFRETLTENFFQKNYNLGGDNYDQCGRQKSDVISEPD